MDNKKITSALNDLLTRNYDAEKGYTEAGNNVNNTMLREWLFENAERRKSFGKELKSLIKGLGETPDKGDSFLGKMHRTWMDIKSSMTDDKEETILEECIRGEKQAIEDYDEVLKEISMPTNIRETVLRQRNAIHSAYKKVKLLEESYETV